MFIFAGITTQLTNYLGLGMLSLPYALRLAGWSALPLLPLTVLFFAITSLMLHTCLAHLPPHTPPTISSLGLQQYGITGQLVARIANSADLFSGACVGLVVAWTQLGILIPTWTSGFGGDMLKVGLSTVAVVPFLLRKNLGELAMASLWGVLCVAFVCVTVVYLVFTEGAEARGETAVDGGGV